MSNLTQVVNTDKNLKSLKKGMHASDMDQLLSSTGPFTFFAPVDNAFEKLKEGTLENLLETQNKPKLLDLINDHTVNGKINFKDLKNGDKLKTISGKELSVTVQNGNVTIGSVTVTERDGRISNGAMHMIDTVLSL